MGDVEEYLDKSVSTEEEPAVVEAPVETPAPEVEEPKGEGAGEDSPEAKEAAEKVAAEAKAKRHESFQERISTKTRQAKEANEKAENYKRRAESAEAKLEEASGEKLTRPKLVDFNYDEEQYEAAIDDYHHKRNEMSSRSARAEEVREDATEATKTAQKAVIDNFQERSTLFAEDHEDYMQVVSNPNLPIGRTITQAVVMAENGPAIMYHLGKNPDVAAEINALPAPMAMMRLGQIGMQLSTPVSKIQTKTPAPANIPKGSEGKVEKDPEKMTPIEYAKHRGYR